MNFAKPMPMIYTDDIQRVADFYVEFFQFRPAYRWPPAPDPAELVQLLHNGSQVWLSLPNEPLHGRRPVTSGKQEVSFVLCLETDDVDSVVDRLRSSGLTILYGPEDHPSGERIAYVADPDGRPVMLYGEIDKSA
ncbi:VOC family protein [Streptoalloteichus hindustanus]|uniref:Lactoylglutathione lyase/glyoxylase I family protein n=1 Tax=Streptoalloteichus hindustanus TaxID=2017 RepID=A0A1M5CGV5_STRHI|nr:VOC family protein [Streptoalloteichus hindustanus]SHF53837.1 lactoylglutathione lyase/glyoxylase I family protein [Streptoalloteichus hindustanus]